MSTADFSRLVKDRRDSNTRRAGGRAAWGRLRARPPGRDRAREFAQLAAEGRRRETLSLQAETDFFRAMARHLRSGHLWTSHVAVLTLLAAEFNSGEPLGARQRFEGTGDKLTLVFDSTFGLFGTDVDPDSRTADWRFLLGHLKKTKWLVVKRAGRNGAIEFRPGNASGASPNRNPAGGAESVVGCRAQGGGMNARQRRRRARRPYAAVPATQQRVDAEYRLLMNAQHELLVGAADERIAQFDPALYELLGEAWEPLQGPDDETPKTRRRRPRRAVKPAPAPEPEPEEVDGVFLASGHQITIQKAAAAEVMKGFSRVELLARGRAAAQRSQERRERLTPVEALPSLAAAAPPAPKRPRDRVEDRARMIQETLGAGIFAMTDLFRSADDGLTARTALEALRSATARPQPQPII